jgi:Flp pilus assembly protein TadB
VGTGSREENASNLVGAAAMDEPEKERNREIAQNEAERQTTGDIRVSAWTIVFAVIAGVIVFAIVWAWLNR